ncbi:hypothetical protein B9479_008166 [Cryptococcus floricola]|uniref:Reverse transcriptase domain-containing protein n=1 Tax=Cryptococcus floricola TaxID=2591691 RepID=A0A5D3AKE5_9TREE|nr:hypothetical protein B9479_008166 [Cryptococcus floricola]
MVTKRKELTAKLLHDFANILPPQLTNVAHYPQPAPSVSRVRHHINILPNTKLVACPYYRLPLAFCSAFKAEIDKHVDARRLCTSSSPWAAPAFLIQKEHGKFRFLCDYRGLNAVTVKDSTPVPSVEDILQRAARGKVFAKLDLTDAFFQTLMNKPDIKKTAIATPWGLYEWVVMPQGW